jgi:endo-alpha-1,4-polygalactosaminidase (GH114 family)
MSRHVRPLRPISMKRYFFLIAVSLLFIASCTPKLEPDLMTSIPSSPLSAGDWWHPAPGLTWQWHLSELPVDTSVEAQVYDIDLFDNEATVIEELHAQGRKVICYISVGSREDWRPDADQFPAEVLGDDYDSWPGEKWLDIRRIDMLAPIMRARLDLCKAKGFDAVEPDNIEIYDNDTGFPISYEDQLVYAKWLADEAHARGLAIGIKNAPDMVADSLSFFDFAITEDAFYYNWADQMLPFIHAGKPVFAAEYTDMDVDFNTACAWGREHNFSFILKNRDLTAFRVTCP